MRQLKALLPILLLLALLVFACVSENPGPQIGDSDFISAPYHGGGPEFTDGGHVNAPADDEKRDIEESDIYKIAGINWN